MIQTSSLLLTSRKKTKKEQRREPGKLEPDSREVEVAHQITTDIVVVVSTHGIGMELPIGARVQDLVRHKVMLAVSLLFLVNLTLQTVTVIGVDGLAH